METMSKKKKGSGFWTLGLLLLAGLLFFGARMYILEKRVWEAEAELDRVTQAEQPDIEEWHRAYQNYLDAQQATHRGWDRKTGGRAIAFGIGFFLWGLTALARCISKAAWRSVERDERREQRKLEKERRKTKDPWD